MPNYRLIIECDEGWFEAISRFTDVDIPEDELLDFIKIEEI